MMLAFPQRVRPPWAPALSIPTSNSLNNVSPGCPPRPLLTPPYTLRCLVLYHLLILLLSVSGAISSAPPVATATSLSSIMSQLRSTSSPHQQISMTSSGQSSGLPSQLKVAAPGGLSQLTDPMQQRIYVQQHLSQQQKQLLQQKQQQLLQQQQQQGLHLNVQWSRTHSDGVIQQQRQVLQSGPIIQRGQQIIQGHNGQQIITQTNQQLLQQQGGQQVLTQSSQQIIQQGQQLLHQQSGTGGQIIQQTQQIIQQTSQQLLQQQQQQQQQWWSQYAGSPQNVNMHQVEQQNAQYLVCFTPTLAT
uniref:Uncharacterized protein n=1 Tax=Cacopsylla melanoneura TaxID=428564 RepID=A0A8D8Y2R4_9HEMI